MNIYYRKLLRVIGLIFPILYFFISKRSLLLILFTIIIIFVFLEFIRLNLLKVNKMIFRLLGFILKRKEEKKISAITLFLLAAFFSILFFRKEIAILVLFFSVFGDSFATIIGRNFGKTKIGDKTLEGSLAFFLSCLIVGILLKDYLLLKASVIVVGSIIPTIIELIPIPFDDNLSIPLATGFMLSFL